MLFAFGTRRAVVVNIAEEIRGKPAPLAAEEIGHLETLDLIYRSLCALLYNYVPTSGHPGGSVSSGRFVANLLFGAMAYDFSNPDRGESDIISYAAGHKAMGLYAMWALRNEIAHAGAPELLPKDVRLQLRLEDMLGFRRNPVAQTPLFVKFGAKPLDGHPTPATPFLRLSTGASGVGVASSLGLAFGAMDLYGVASAPRVHIVEGEGGMTPGRVAEAFAAAGTASLSNAIIHVDWNQASIDSNHVCRDEKGPGDYVQWDPIEFAHLHDWNAILVPDGKDLQQIAAAQVRALSLENGQPTAIVYRTVKGWQYGIEGRASHGAGHKLCSEGFYAALKPLIALVGGELPACGPDDPRCEGGKIAEVYEACFWESLGFVRRAIEKNGAMTTFLARKLAEAKGRLEKLARKPRAGAPRIETIFDAARGASAKIPPEFKLSPGTATTLRGELGRVLNFYNKASGGAILAASADLLGSTSVNEAAKGFPEGFFNARTNPGARLLSTGGICEDAMAGILSGLASYGHHLGVGSSYGAFIAPLGHIAARLHAIGGQSRRALAPNAPYRPFVLVCGHAGLKTGEDGPTHADPQALQLLQENFPRGTAITLTPWEPQEIWPLFTAALEKRPALIAPFVTRPNEKVPDREKLGFPQAAAAVSGVVCLRRAKGKGDGTVVLQESGVTYAFVDGTLPLLLREGADLNIYYIASAELFDLLPPAEQARTFPEEHAREAMGITGFTLPTIFRWTRSEFGQRMTMHPFQKGHYLGSGQAEMVLAEAGLDGESQFRQVMKYVRERQTRDARCETRE